MNRTLKCALSTAAALLLSATWLTAQESNPTSTPATDAAVVTQNGNVFFYKINVVQRDIDAINYLHRTGQTKIAFQGTDLLPGGKGDAIVKSERGLLSVHAEFKGLTPANGFGPEYLTYVLWAISPDGRPVNLGEILPDGTKNNIDATVPLQSFGMIVTAEPYFAVSTPSDVVVLKNVILKDETNGVLERVNAHATLLPRGTYTEDGAHTIPHPITRDEKSPLELYEAYNALRIAQAAGAEKYSGDTYAKAQLDLKNAADIDASKHRDTKLEITYAREGVQRAEDARVDTLRKKAAERQANAESAKLQAQNQAAESAAQAQASQLESEKAQLAQQQAQLQAQQAQAQAAQAQAAKAQADAAAAAAAGREQAANDRAAAIAQQAKEARERLRAQLNAILVTVETPRGLVVNLSDVLFDTGRYTLKPNTQIALARIAGILQSYQGLKVQVEGYTDSTGSDAINQKLSENRANTTRDWLVKQGVSMDNITAAGYGPSNPVADNGTAAGRAQNRRVNLVVSGDAIGVVQSAAPTPQ